MNSKNSGISDPHNLTDKINLKRAFYNAWKDIKKPHKTNKFKIPVPTWNEEFELPDGSYSVLDIQDHFEYFIKKYETVTDNPSIMICVTKNIK